MSGKIQISRHVFQVEIFNHRLCISAQVKIRTIAFRSLISTYSYGKKIEEGPYTHRHTFEYGRFRKARVVYSRIFVPLRRRETRLRAYSLGLYKPRYFETEKAPATHARPGGPPRPV